MLVNNLKKCYPLVGQIRHYFNCSSGSIASDKLRHLICFKQWTEEMVSDVLQSALNLKRTHRDTHHLRLDTLENAKIMILQEINEPVLNMAVSKAATLLGASHVSIKDHLVWEHDYNGRIFSYMSDAIFVTTATHMCVQRLANMSTVPVLCMKSRTHSTIQSLATIMAIMEEYESVKSLNIAWVGAPHPVLNSYLLLFPMLGANITFKCCCKECPVSPLLLKASQDMLVESHTSVKEQPVKKDCIENAAVFISGPTCSKKEKVHEFDLSIKDIEGATRDKWTYFHTCPRGEEVNDELFYHENSRTFQAFENMHYIAASLMAYCIKEETF